MCFNYAKDETKLCKTNFSPAGMHGKSRPSPLFIFVYKWRGEDIDFKTDVFGSSGQREMAEASSSSEIRVIPLVLYDFPEYG